MAQPTIRDVAALAGVAPSTVSVVLNEVEGARVGSDTRRRVHEAAQVLGYTGNDFARHLRRGRRTKHTVALVNDVIATGPYGGALIEGAQAAAWRRGALLAVLNTGGHPEREKEAIKAARQHHADAIVLASLSFEARPVEAHGDIVLANCAPATAGRLVPHVIPDETGAGAAVARELVGLGHTEIAVVTVAGSLAASDRLSGFRAALRRSGIRVPPGNIVRLSRVDATAEGGHRAAAALLAATPGFTAMWCFNDRMAMGAYRAAAESGRPVPGSLSIVGFDDLEPVAESLSPSLTTMALPYYEIGEQAVEIALDRQHPVRHSATQRLRLRSTLVRRFSAAPCSSQKGAAVPP